MFLNETSACVSQFESDLKNVYIWSAFVYDVWTTDFVR
jgi:hypothetical protein